MKIDESFATAAIRISTKRTASEVSSLIPLKPSRISERGRSPAGESRWIYESKEAHSEVEAHIEHLLGVIESNRASFEALPSDCEVDIWCTVSSPREFVGLALSRSILKRIAALNLEVIFGLYRGEDKSTH